MSENKRTPACFDTDKVNQTRVPCDLRLPNLWPLQSHLNHYLPSLFLHRSRSSTCQLTSNDQLQRTGVSVSGKLPGGGFVRDGGVIRYACAEALGWSGISRTDRRSFCHCPCLLRITHQWGGLMINRSGLKKQWVRAVPTTRDSRGCLVRWFSQALTDNPLVGETGSIRGRDPLWTTLILLFILSVAVSSLSGAPASVQDPVQRPSPSKPCLFSLERLSDVSLL